jgi:hypothetical protein
MAIDLLVGAWQTRIITSCSQQGTAFFWPKKTWLDLNYHVKNYALTRYIRCFSVRLFPNVTNVAHTPSSPTIEMKTRLVNNIGIVILPNFSGVIQLC